ncbi:MAG: endonuclease/exonuclease/phosphatase family protein [Anaerolineae bacterium]
MMITVQVSQPSRLALMARVLVNMFVVLVGAYGLSVSGLLLLRALVGESWSLIGLANTYLYLLLLPAIVLLPLCLFLRRRLLIVELATPFLFFVFTFGSSFLPRTVAALGDIPRIHLLSYNINRGNRQVESVIQNIKNAAADVVLIQELSPWMTEAFLAQLSELYPYRAFHPQDSFNGQGALSKFPILVDDYWQINLGHQRIEIDWNGIPVTLYNVHPVHPLNGLGYEGERRAMEVRDVLQRMSKEQNRLLLVGDFNMTELAGDYARVSALYADTYKQVGWGMGFTFPDFASAFGVYHLPPIARIDYVFHDENFIPLEARVLPDSGGSDHFPLYAVLGLKESLP